MGSFIDLTGQRFGRLVAISRAENNGKYITWNCVCDCGNECFIRGQLLRSKKTKSCGCYKREVSAENGRRSREWLIKDKLGNRYGSLVVISSGRATPSGHMWLCRCDCGKEKLIRSSSLRPRGTKSCGCGLGTYLPPGEASFNALYKSYYHGAKGRSLCFDLTKLEFMQITKQPCFYCGIKPHKEFVATRNGSYIYNGVDRYNSNTGYTTDNVVPCCTECNLAKSDRGVEEFVLWIHRASNHLYTQESVKS